VCGEGRQGGAKGVELGGVWCRGGNGRSHRSVEDRAAQGGFRELREERLEFQGENKDSFGFQGAPDAGQGLGEMAFEDFAKFGGVGAGFDGTFEERGEQQAALLELGENFYGGLSCCGDGESGEDNAGLASEVAFGRVEKIGVGFRCSGYEQQGLDVDGAETGGPFEALEAARDVLGGG